MRSRKSKRLRSPRRGPSYRGSPRRGPSYRGSSGRRSSYRGSSGRRPSYRSSDDVKMDNQHTLVVNILNGQYDHAATRLNDGRLQIALKMPRTVLDALNKRQDILDSGRVLVASVSAGDRVVLHGLSTTKWREMNELHGVVIRWRDDMQRWEIHLDGHEPGRNFIVLPTNVRLETHGQGAPPT